MSFNQNSLSEKSNNKDAKKDNKWTVVLVLFVVVFILTGLIIFALLKLNNDKSESSVASSETTSETITETKTEATTTEVTTEMLTENSIEETEVATTEEETSETTTEEITESTTEVAETVSDEESHRTEIPDEGLIWYMNRGGSFYVPAGFENVTKEVYALRYVHEFYNSELDMNISVIETMQHDIPISLDEEYEDYISGTEDLLSLNKKEADGYIVSGIDDEQRVFYRKVKLVDDKYYSVGFNYPESNSETCNNIVEDFVSTLKYD